MTDRVMGLVVTLDVDMRSDDAKAVIDAIMTMRHVIGVSPVVADHNDWINRERIRRELGLKLMNVLYPEKA